MSGTLTAVRTEDVAGMGFFRDKDGNLKRGHNKPDPMWIRRKGYTFIGCAVMDGESELPAIQSLIAQSRQLGDEETVKWLEGKLKETRENFAKAEAALREIPTPEAGMSAEDRRLVLLAKTVGETVVEGTIEKIEERAATRRASQSPSK